MTRTSVVDRYGEGKPHVYKVRMTEQQIRDEIFSKQGMQGISTEPKWSTLAETRLLMLMVKYKPVGIHKHNNLGHLHMYMNHIYAFEDGVGCFLYDADHAEYASQLGLPPHLRSGAYTPKYYIRPSVEQIWEKINTWYDLWWAECNEELPQELIKEKTFRLPSSYFMDVRTEPVDESGVAEAVSNLSVRSPDAVRPIPSHNLRRHRKATSRPSCGGWTAEDTRPPLQVSRGFTRKKGKQAIQEQQSKRARSSHGGPKIPFKDVLRGRRSRKLPDQTSPKAEKRSSHRELSESGGQRRLSRSENARASRSGVPAPKSCEPLVKSRSHPEKKDAVSCYSKECAHESANGLEKAPKSQPLVYDFTPRRRDVVFARQRLSFDASSGNGKGLPEQRSKRQSTEGTVDASGSSKSVAEASPPHSDGSGSPELLYCTPPVGKSETPQARRYALRSATSALHSTPPSSGDLVITETACVVTVGVEEE